MTEQQGEECHTSMKGVHEHCLLSFAVICIYVTVYVCRVYVYIHLHLLYGLQLSHLQNRLPFTVMLCVGVCVCRFVGQTWRLQKRNSVKETWVSSWGVRGAK